MDADHEGPRVQGLVRTRGPIDTNGQMSFGKNSCSQRPMIETISGRKRKNKLFVQDFGVINGCRIMVEFFFYSHR